MTKPADVATFIGKLLSKIMGHEGVKKSQVQAELQKMELRQKESSTEKARRESTGSTSKS